MAGYSGTPLAKKLGIKPGARYVLVDAPASFTKELAGELASMTKITRGAFDFAVAFAKDRGALASELERLEPRLDDAGMLWIAWPKKSAKIATDVTEDTVRELALPMGLVDVKVCAIDETGSGLRLVRRLERRSTRR